MSAPTFAHERLDAFVVAEQFLELAQDWARRLPRSKGQIGDQLQRASESILLRLAEGAGAETGSADQRRHFRAARGSALECAAILTVLRTRKALNDEALAEGRGLLLRVVQMTSRLARRR